MKNKKGQKGFSLIELMMVVVIIGVLAGVGIPQYQKFQMRARQSEVKSLLSSMYTSQKAFFAEWNQFYGDFNAVAYGLNGNLGYRVSFGSSNVNGPATHPNTTYRNAAPAVVNSTAFCSLATNGCNDLQAKAAGIDTVGVNTTLTTFRFGGAANLDDDPANDTWSIDHNKTFTQSTDDISLVN